LREQREWYTQEEASAILGRSSKWLSQRIARGELKATRIRKTQAGEGQGLALKVSRAALRRFILDNSHNLDPAAINLVEVLNIVRRSR